jgi:tetratricopeptide (TPR) repeat protein
MYQAGWAKLWLGADDEAIAWFRRSIESNRNYASVHFSLGAALAHLGRLDEARSAIKAGLALNPKLTVSLSAAIGAAASDDPTYLAGAERVSEGMRKAGLPEE